MAETPLTPATPENQPEQPAAAPTETAAAPAAEPALEAVVDTVETVVEAAVDVVVEEEPEVEGWSGSPSAASAPEAIARPGTAAAEAAAELDAEPSIAATLEVPPLPGAGSAGGAGASAEGGEFDLLISKISAWLEGLELAERWQKLRGPLRGAALLLGLLLALRLYARVVGTIDGIPVISGLLELTGLIYALWFSATKLIRTSERERVLNDWKGRWQAFSGRD